MPMPMPISLTDLPLNVLTEILARLPLKTLIAAKCACKTFLQLASPHDSYFIDNHSHSQSHQHLLIFVFENENQPLSNPLHYIFDPQVDKPDLDVASPILDAKPFRIMDCRPHPNQDTWYRLLNSCNGLLLFSKEDLGHYAIVVCNPITNEYLTIGVDYDTMLTSFRLGFCPGTNQYKILKITVFGYEECWSQAEVVELELELELGCGSRSSRSWRPIKGSKQPHTNFVMYNGYDVFLDGIIYALYKVDGHNDTLGFFDYEREEFGEIMLPGRGNCNVGVMGDSVCLIYTYSRKQKLAFWVLERSVGNTSNWSKKFVVNARGVPNCFNRRPQQVIRPMQVLRNGQIFMVCGGHVICYDPKRKSLRQVELKIKHSDTFSCTTVFNLNPTFVSLDNTLKLHNNQITMDHSQSESSNDDLPEILHGFFGPMI